VPLPVCDHSQGVYFPPNTGRRSKVFRILFQQTNEQTFKARVPGLPIRVCAGSFNNLAQMCPKLSAINVTAKTFSERLYLVPGISLFDPHQLSLCTHTPTVHSTTVSQFQWKFFSQVAPKFFCHWLMIAFVTWISNLVPLLEGLCSSNPCRFKFSIFKLFAGNEPTTLGLTARALTNWVSFTSSRIKLVLHGLGALFVK